MMYSTDLVIHNGKETLLFYYPNLIINSLFIYWIGYIGFVKPHLLITKEKSQPEIENTAQYAEMEREFMKLMDENEIYRNKRISLREVGQILGVSEQALSHFINEKYQMNFSELMNFYRVKKVQLLMADDNAELYTLLALAEDAGFNSKSTFNESFKKITGLTPSAYRKNKFQ